MTRKFHYLVAASDGKAPTQLTSIYAISFSDAWEQACAWQARDCPELPTLSVVVQPQGFQAGCIRLPGCLDDEVEYEIVNVGSHQVYRPKGSEKA